MFTICNNIDYQRVNLLLSLESVSDWREEKREKRWRYILVSGWTFEERWSEEKCPSKEQIFILSQLREKMNELLFALFSNQA